MSNIIKISKKTSVVIFSLLLISVIAVAFISLLAKPTSNPLLNFAIRFHTWIMAGAIVISIVYGYYLSSILYKEVKSQKRTSKNILEVVLKFLSLEERKVINFIVENNGKTTQAEISRIDNMGRVKAFRALQKMQEKNLIEVTSHGKIRYVTLKEEILNLLSKE